MKSHHSLVCLCMMSTTPSPNSKARSKVWELELAVPMQSTHKGMISQGSGTLLLYDSSPGVCVRGICQRSAAAGSGKATAGAQNGGEAQASGPQTGAVAARQEKEEEVIDLAGEEEQELAAASNPGMLRLQ